MFGNNPNSNHRSTLPSSPLSDNVFESPVSDSFPEPDGCIAFVNRGFRSVQPYFQFLGPTILNYNSFVEPGSYSVSTYYEGNAANVFGASQTASESRVFPTCGNLGKPVNGSATPDRPPGITALADAVGLSKVNSTTIGTAPNNVNGTNAMDGKSGRQLGFLGGFAKKC